jgi:4-hydroxybenzoate polyprenyltransferase
MNFAWAIAKSLRPRQWLKNISVFAALFLSGQLFNPIKFQHVCLTFFAFSLAASSMYLINDIVDREKDRLHPVKKYRPIASGALPVPTAIIVCVVTLTASVLLVQSLNRSLLVMLLGYIGLQFAYSFLFKRVIIIDAMLISLGFVLRVYAGAFVIKEPLSAWLLLSVATGSWFLALGKRRSELTLMGHRIAGEHRSTLLHYPEVLIDSLTTMSATAAIIFYSLFAFLSNKQPLLPYAQFLPSTLEAPKLMMLTIPFVVYGIARYLYIIYEKKEADSPEIALMHDWPLLLDITAWLILIFIFVYLLPQGGTLG